MTLYCKYCNQEILDKKKDSRIADGERYHIVCLRIFRKELEKLRQSGKLKPGQENKVPVNQDKFINKHSLNN